MKKLLLSFLVLLCLQICAYAQTWPGKMRILLKDKLTGMPLSSTSYTVTLNDSTKSVLISDAQGHALTGNLVKGPYKVEIACNMYLNATINNIIIGEGKTAYITMELIPARVLTRKEKKRLGIR